MIRLADNLVPQFAFADSPLDWRNLRFWSRDGTGGYLAQSAHEVPGSKGNLCQHPVTNDWVLWLGGANSGPDLNPWTCAAYALRLESGQVNAYEIWREEEAGGGWSMAALASHEYAYMSTGQPPTSEVPEAGRPGVLYRLEAL